jgi:hypothetical protein
MDMCGICFAASGVGIEMRKIEFSQIVHRLRMRDDGS